MIDARQSRDGQRALLSACEVLWDKRSTYLPLMAAAGVFAFFWWLSPAEEPALRLCPFYWLTSRPCPLCGITRAFCALAKGHWGQAIHFNALSPLAFVMLFSLFWNWRWRAQLWTWGLAAIATYGICRAALA